MTQFAQDQQRELRAPTTLQARAIDNLRYIRETMENAEEFTAVPGWGGVAMGVIGLVGAILAGSATTSDGFLLTWIATALVALVIGSSTMALKARAAGQRVSHGAGRRFMLSLSPPLAAAAVLSVVLYRAGFVDAIPGTWLLLYGVGVVTGGAFSVRAVPLMGLGFMVLGAATFLLPLNLANFTMAAGFGLLHVVFGAIIARRHGG